MTGGITMFTLNGSAKYFRLKMYLNQSYMRERLQKAFCRNVLKWHRPLLQDVTLEFIKKFR